MTYLAVPISGADTNSATEQIKAAKTAGAQILELRTDYLKDLTTDSLCRLLESAKATSLPIIVTCRDSAQGGKNDHPQQLRTAILVEALNAGADYIDCEYDNFLKPQIKEQLLNALSQQKTTRLILSAHNFDAPFRDLKDLCDDILQTCPDAIPKLVYTASHINDCFPAFDLLNEKTEDIIVFCMAQPGFISRIITKKLGGFLTFASLDDGSATAPGQITIRQLKELYRFDHIDKDTKLFGVIASPIAHSLSPDIFNVSFDHQDSNSLYLPLLIEGQAQQFNEFIENITSRPWLNFGGFSVTIPHKTNALDYVEKHGEFLEPLAAEIGAVNTLKVGLTGRVSGYNTDYAGALDALTSTMSIKKHKLHKVDIAVLGAGGVARAVVAALTDVGAKLTIYNRTEKKAQSLAEEFNCKYAPLDRAQSLDARVIVNCTSIGMYPNIDDTPLPPQALKPEMFVFDTVYNPVETTLLKDAAAAGAKTITGAQMFLRQAMAQYKIFTGKEPDEQIMEKTITNRLTP